VKHLKRMLGEVFLNTIKGSDICWKEVFRYIYSVYQNPKKYREISVQIKTIGVYNGTILGNNTLDLNLIKQESINCQS
jgi:hypothetical protein